MRLQTFLLGKSCFGFTLGFGIGVLLALSLILTNEDVPNVLEENSSGLVLGGKSYQKWLENRGFHSKVISFPGSSLSNVKTESDFLFSKVNVLCAVLFENLENAYSAKYTWGQRCNKMQFYGQTRDVYLQANEVKSKTTWEFLCRSLRHLWQVHRHGMEWIIVTLDDTFVIPENLRYTVVTLNSSLPYYFGHNLMFWNQIYNSAKAGFVLSRGALEAFSSKFNSTSVCIDSVKYNRNEDYYLGKFLGELGVVAGDARDDMGRERFHEFTPQQLMAVGSPEVLRKYSKKSIHKVVQGRNCCSPTSITFRGVEEDMIFFYSYLLYTVRVTNSLGPAIKPKTITKDDQVWKRFILEEFGPDVNLSKITADVYYEIWTIKEQSPEEFNRKIREQVLGLKKHQLV